MSKGILNASGEAKTNGEKENIIQFHSRLGERELRECNARNFYGYSLTMFTSSSPRRHGAIIYSHPQNKCSHYSRIRVEQTSSLVTFLWQKRCLLLLHNYLHKCNLIGVRRASNKLVFNLCCSGANWLRGYQINCPSCCQLFAFGCSTVLDLAFHDKPEKGASKWYYLIDTAHDKLGFDESQQTNG